MHPFYNPYGNSGNVEHLYEDNNWIAPPSNTPMKDIEGRRQTCVLFCANNNYLFIYYYYIIIYFLL